MDHSEAIEILQSLIDNMEPGEETEAAERALKCLQNPEPAAFRWTITIEADRDLVADGFDVANQIDGKDGGGELSELGRIVDRWETWRCKLRIIDAPDPRTIRRAQGHTDE